MFFKRIKKSGQLSEFPVQSTVHLRTCACLTSVFEMGTGEPGSYDRP